jgi:transglutaminase-like putative cysteine protease
MPRPSSEPPADAVPLRREVASTMVLEVVEPTALVFAVAVASGVPTTVESLRIRIDGDELAPREVPDRHGGRLHVFDAPPGILAVDYAATVAGRAAPAPVEPLDAIVALRPSRYVQSDTLTPFARRTFPGLDGLRLVREVEAWVHDRLDYEAAASSPTGGAVETLDAGAGVCRDFAHLTAAILRALDVPARLVSVYAPGIEPPDFHAVVEALVDDRWVLVDATRLAPRSTMVRIATGRDAADTAFETNTLADVRLLRLDVRASSDPAATEDPAAVLDLT